MYHNVFLLLSNKSFVVLWGRGTIGKRYYRNQNTVGLRNGKVNQIVLKRTQSNRYTHAFKKYLNLLEQLYRKLSRGPEK